MRHRSPWRKCTAVLQSRYGEEASIGVVPMFEKFLGKKTILLGFGLDTDAIHSPNENYSLAQFFRGIETIPYFYEFFARQEE